MSGLSAEIRANIERAKSLAFKGWRLIGEVREAVAEVRDEGPTYDGHRWFSKRAVR